MSQPTPEEWWNGLGEADRGAFMMAARSRTLTEDLFLKLNDAGVPTWEWQFPGNPAAYTWPLAYLRFVLDKAAERPQ